MLDRLRQLYTSTVQWCRRKKTVLLKVAVALCLVLIAGGTATGVILYSAFQRVTVKSSALPTPLPSSTPKPFVDAFNQLEPYSQLLLGYGGGGHEGGKLTDSILLAHIIPADKQIYLIAIPRDTWVALPTVGGGELTHWKVNAAYPIGLDDRTYPHKPLQYTGEAGGGQLAKTAVHTITNLPVDSFAAIDFAGFIRTINALGGITVQVERTFTDPLYPIEELKNDSCGRIEEDIAAITATMSATQIEHERMFPCRYETLSFTAGSTVMDAETALKYARSRHSTEDGGDFNRAARQRQVLLAVKKKVLATNFFPKILPLISSLSYSLQTDLTTEKLEEFLRYSNDLSTSQITSIALSTENVLANSYSSNGQFILAPRAGEDNWSDVHTWLEQQMTATESATTATGQE